MKIRDVGIVVGLGAITAQSKSDKNQPAAFISHSLTRHTSLHPNSKVSANDQTASMWFSPLSIASLNRASKPSLKHMAPLADHAESSEIITTQRGDKILKPVRTEGEPSALILLPGAELSPEAYLSLAKKVQQAVNQPLWVGIVKLEMPVANAYMVGRSIPLVALEDYINPASIDQELQTALSEMFRCGMPNIKPYISGHSLGGAFLHHAVAQRPSAYAGMIHLASFLPRYLDAQNHPALKLPNLTVCAELDGLIGVMRFAEAFYKQVCTEQSTPQPVVMVEGMNHGQFAQGSPPEFVERNDLPAERSSADSQNQVASLVGDFINSQGSVYQDSLLAQSLSNTQHYFEPLIAALKLEGNYHLQPPCSSLKEGDQPCWQGSPWVEQLTPLVTGALEEGAALENTDTFHPSWIINLPGVAEQGKPLFHHPKVRMSGDGSSQDQNLVIRTVSEAVYDPLTSLDLGIVPNTACKIRAKFPSRQAVKQQMGQALDFSESEYENIASRMNQLAMDWALENAPPAARQRYLERGIKLVAGQDIPVFKGPDWIWSDFDKKLAQDEQGRPIYVIDSTIMKTPLDNGFGPLKKVFPAAGEKADEWIGGKHFMTLLSPASAMAHICTDSLRSPKPIADRLI